MTTESTATTETSTSRTEGSTLRQLVGAEVLVIDKDLRVQQGMTALLSAADLHVTCVDDPHNAWELLEKQFFSVVIADLDTPRPNAGLETVATVQIASPTSMVIMLTPRKSFDDAVEAIRAGAVDVIHKSPESVQYLKERVMAAAGRSVDKREVDSVLAEVKELQDQFLKRFMEAERRALDLNDRLTGHDPSNDGAEVIRFLVVSGNAELASELTAATPSGYEFESAVSGGQALDRCSASRFHVAMVAEDLSDLPRSMVLSSIKTQNPEMLVLAFSGPGPTGTIELAEGSRRIPLVPEFTDSSQLVSRLDHLTEAFRVRERERRYVQAFRERHYDFLRKYVALKAKIDRALS